MNLAEGTGKPSKVDQRRFYAMALGSLRETQALLRLVENAPIYALTDRLGGMLYRLVHPK